MGLNRRISEHSSSNTQQKKNIWRSAAGNLPLLKLSCLLALLGVAVMTNKSNKTQISNCWEIKLMMSEVSKLCWVLYCNLTNLVGVVVVMMMMMVSKEGLGFMEVS